MKRVCLTFGLLLIFTGIGFAAGGDTFKITLSSITTAVAYPGTVKWMYAISYSSMAQNIILCDNATEKYRFWVTTASAVPAQTEIMPSNLRFKTSIKARYSVNVDTTACPVTLYLGIE